MWGVPYFVSIILFSAVELDACDKGHILGNADRSAGRWDKGQQLAYDVTLSFILVSGNNLAGVELLAD